MNSFWSTVEDLIPDEPQWQEFRSEVERRAADAVKKPSDKFEQRVRVESEDYDGDDSGHEWTIFYVIYETENDDGQTVFELWKDDNKGNGEGLGAFYKRSDAFGIVQKLGTLVEYREGQKPLSMDEYARLTEHGELYALVNTLLESNDEGYMRDVIQLCHSGELHGPIDNNNLHLFRRYRNAVTASAATLIEEAKQARKFANALR